MKDDGENYALNPNTVYAIELNTTINIPEWNRDIRIMLEEAGYYGEHLAYEISDFQVDILLTGGRDDLTIAASAADAAVAATA